MNRIVAMQMLLVMLTASGVAAADKPVAGKPAKPAPEPQPVTAAVLDYEIALPGNANLGSQMAEILTARLSIEESIQLVERSKMGKILDEQKLKLVGLVDQAQAVKVGKLFGAKLLIMGKGFVMDKKLMIVTKVVGVETGLIKGSIRTVELSKPISDAIMLLSEDIATLIRKNGVKLLPKGSTIANPVAEIRKKLGKKPRPSVAVIIPEQHRTRRPAPRPVDPAVETEIKKLLIECGFTVIDVGKNDLADWAKDMLKGKNPAWPVALHKADVIVVGEAFSEFALRMGDLVTCAARGEVNMIDRHSGRILKADRETTRAVDLAEVIAGKTALQKVGRRIGIDLCKELVAYKMLAKKTSTTAPSTSGGKRKAK